MLAPRKGSSPVLTQCIQPSFAFAQHFRRDVVARFDGGAITSGASGLLLRETDRRIDLLLRFAACLEDRRDPDRVEHRVRELVFSCGNSRHITWVFEISFPAEFSAVSWIKKLGWTMPAFRQTTDE